MIIHYLRIVDIAVLPVETDPPLVIDAYGVFAFAVIMQLLKAVTRRDRQVIEPCRRIKHRQFSLRYPVKSCGEMRRASPIVNLLRRFSAKAL